MRRGTRRALPSLPTHLYGSTVVTSCPSPLHLRHTPRCWHRVGDDGYPHATTDPRTRP